MNFYIIVEGEGTEPILYPSWLEILTPKYSQIYHFKEVKNNNYFLFSGGGIPHIYNHTANAIKDINKYGGYDFLIVCMDSEELTTDSRKEKLVTHLKDNHIELNSSCELIVIVQNVCIETWFLGNQKVFKRNPSGEKFREYSHFYNVEFDDPELMPAYNSFTRKAHFHEAYLREMLKEHNISYRKSKPNSVTEEYYLQELQKRISIMPNQLSSLKHFFDVCKLLNRDKY